MSSLVRRVEKRLMKRAGYTREPWIIEKDARGNPQVVKVRRGGEITDPDDTPIGRHWPARIPSRAGCPTKPQPKNFRNPRALRRTKKTKRWLAARREAMSA